MARPIKDGVDYWPFDVGLLRDKKMKLIKSEFGIKGAYIALAILNSVYEENGYYKLWDDDDCLLMSDGVGDGCTPELVAEVVNGCIRRSLFDKGVFDKFNILTSAGIQRRFIKIVGNCRPDIQIMKEIWLLDMSNKKDIPQAVSNKVSFFSINFKDNPINFKDNPNNFKDNTQRKEKKSKVKKSKENSLSQAQDTCDIPNEILSEWKAYVEMRKLIKKPMTGKAVELAISKLNTLAPNNFKLQKDILNQSVMNSWQGLFELKQDFKNIKPDYSDPHTYDNIKEMEDDEIDRIFGTD